MFSCNIKASCAIVFMTRRFGILAMAESISGSDADNLVFRARNPAKGGVTPNLP